jgi:hypothetical protein
MPRFALLFLLTLAPTASATDFDPWLTPNGAGKLPWGTTRLPMASNPKERSFYLPDAGYIGARPTDRPEDMELPGPHPGGERRFLRYVGTTLVDGWLLREGSIDTTIFEVQGTEQWRGALLGPAEGDLKAVGDAVSWTLGSRTALHWKDRMTDREILVVRAQPSARYAVRRASPLEPGPDTGHRARLVGNLKQVAKPVLGHLAGCFDAAPKPVTGTVEAVFDRLGRLGRVHVRSNQPALEIEACIAGGFMRVGAPPSLSGHLEIFRMR